ncbi:MAG: hypothetical protein M9932_10880 [Xanthobacteraceae bacterium]|nr:hypothetical protein [Xanthobacteraceae bacterium]
MPALNAHVHDPASGRAAGGGLFGMLCKGIVIRNLTLIQFERDIGAETLAAFPQ